MEWTDVKITVPRSEAGTAEAIATSVSSSGIYIEDYTDLEQLVEAIAHVDLIEQELLDKDRTVVSVHLYLSPQENPAEVLQLLQERIQGEQLHAKLEISGVEEQDWSTSWKAYYHAMELGERLAICPSWEAYSKSCRAVLKLDPGMAFGTGTHETTALCLKALDDLVCGGERVLDIGTGSGILAIAALLLGAKSAEGIDIDPMCVRTARENAQRNKVQNRFIAKVGNLSDQAEGTYDLICANIVANAILSLSPDVPTLLCQGGTFIASGIVDEREAEVVDAVKAAGLVVTKIERENGWVCLQAMHPQGDKN